MQATQQCKGLNRLGEEKAERWSRTPLWDLGKRTPEQVLRDNPESFTVESIIGRIEGGIYS